MANPRIRVEVNAVALGDLWNMIDFLRLFGIILDMIISEIYEHIGKKSI